MTKLLSHFVILIITVLLFCVTSCINDKENTSGSIDNYVVVGDVIPDFTITDASGEVFSSDSFEGKRSLLVFFHTDCSDCKRELPIIDKVWQILKKESDIMFIAIARGQKENETSGFWKDKGFTMPKYHDPKREIFNLFANSYVPRLYLIDKNKVVTWMGIEEFNLTSAQLIEMVAEMKD